MPGWSYQSLVYTKGIQQAKMKLRPRMLAIHWEAKWHLLWLTGQGEVPRDGWTYLLELSTSAGWYIDAFRLDETTYTGAVIRQEGTCMRLPFLSGENKVSGDPDYFRRHQPSARGMAEHKLHSFEWHILSSNRSICLEPVSRTSPLFA